MERGCHGRRGRPAKGERGVGQPSVGEGEKGWRPSRGKRGKRPPLGFLCGRKETMPQMTLT
jgi:hypothetical protein